MRNQWRRLILLRCYSRSQPHISILSPSHSPVQSLRSISSSSILPSSRTLHAPLYQSRFFSSSEVAVEPPKDTSDQNQINVLTEIFSKPQTDIEKIKQELEYDKKIVINHDFVLAALKNLQSAAHVARRFFKWVYVCKVETLSSKSYNLMLNMLVQNGFVREFWDMVGIMKKIGYGVSKGVFLKALEKFEKDGLNDDVKKLKELFASGSTDNSVANHCSRVCRVIRRDVWGDDVEKRLTELNVEFSGELVSMVVENLGRGDNKGLIFFRWVEERGLFKHDQRTFNAMARVLANENSTELFWRMVDEMRNAGFEMEKDTYVKVSEWFVKRKMIRDAVDLYEFAMDGINKPSVQDCTFLLKKIVVSKELDLDLFSRVARIFKENGNILTNATLNAVLKSLNSVGRNEECTKILKAMEEGGVVPSGSLLSKIAFCLSSSGKSGEASEFTDNIEASGSSPDHKTWTSLVEGYCQAGDLEKASTSFREMVEKVGPGTTGYALESLISVYCRENRAMDAYHLVSEMVNEKELHPWHSTFKILIGMLLAQGGFGEALAVLPLMKNQGYPPFVDPFIEYLSKSGSPDDSMAFSKAMTVKRFPSPPVFLQLFEAYFKVGRHDEAQDFLLKCPRYIRNHSEVLNLFCSKNSGIKAPVPDMTA